VSGLLRVYLDPAEIGTDGYPYAWHTKIKGAVRADAGHRCVRCSHPYDKGAGEWSRCDELCFLNDRHGFGPGLARSRFEYDGGSGEGIEVVEARWRILTVHHLNGVKHDCRWWNLVALCQRCHLSVQSRVTMERVYPFEHSDWFKPYAAGWYAHAYLGEDLTREETMGRLDELLNLERMDR